MPRSYRNAALSWKKGKGDREFVTVLNAYLGSKKVGMVVERKSGSWEAWVGSSRVAAGERSKTAAGEALAYHLKWTLTKADLPAKTSGRKLRGKRSPGRTKGRSSCELCGAYPGEEHSGECRFLVRRSPTTGRFIRAYKNPMKAELFDEIVSKRSLGTAKDAKRKLKKMGRDQLKEIIKMSGNGPAGLMAQAELNRRRRNVEGEKISKSVRAAGYLNGKRKTRKKSRRKSR